MVEFIIWTAFVVKQYKHIPKSHFAVFHPVLGKNNTLKKSGAEAEQIPKKNVPSNPLSSVNVKKLFLSVSRAGQVSFRLFFVYI